MKTIWLLPYRYRSIGAIISIPLILVIVFCHIFHLSWELPFLQGSFMNWFNKSGEQNPGNFTDEIAFTLIIVGQWMIGFSKLKVEDEQTNSLRLNALYWAVLAYHVLLLIEYWLFYNISFLVILPYNSLICLVLYILRFYTLVQQQEKALSDEE